MTHYRSNLRDIAFNLFECNGVDGYLGTGVFAEFDGDAARDVLRELERFASGPWADSFVEGDRTPLRLEDGNVMLPPGVTRSLQAFFDRDWHLLFLPPELGGMGAPPSIAWAASELFMGANAGAMFYTAGPFFARIADALVTPEQRARWVLPWVKGQWGGTMVLTEPDAGSDVGAGRTKAVEAGDGTWHLSGTKRFITNGDFDLPENIVHLVLARPERGGPGTKGLSLFLVPKFWVEPDGSLGPRNGVTVVGLEDKMGIKTSSTCEVVFGAEENLPARGVLVGEVHDGIAQMFKVIEYARMLVGTKAMATLSTGYLHALAYAKERVQGPDLKQSLDKAAPRVEIIRHPDVRRSLMAQKAHVEGMRALVLYTAHLQDLIELGAEDTAQAGELARRNDLLLPLVKGYASEKSYELLAQSLQVLGGSGYTRDHPLEQYLRDAKIDTLYEGTTGIQGMDLFFRKIGKNQGATLAALLGEIQLTAKGDAGNGQLAAERTRLAAALEDLQGMLAAMVGFLGDDLAQPGRSRSPDLEGQGIYKIGLNTTTFLFSLAEVVIGWLLLRQAEVALAALDDDPGEADQAFYTGKVAAARWFAHNVLPLLSSRREVLAATGLEVMAIPDEAF